MGGSDDAHASLPGLAHEHSPRIALVLPPPLPAASRGLGRELRGPGTEALDGRSLRLRGAGQSRARTTAALAVRQGEKQPSQPLGPGSGLSE